MINVLQLMAATETAIENTPMSSLNDNSTTIIASLISAGFAFLGSYLINRNTNKKEAAKAAEDNKSEMERLFTEKVAALLDTYSNTTKELRSEIERLTDRNINIMDQLKQIQDENKELLESNRRLMVKNEELNIVNQELMRKNEELLSRFNT